MAQLHLHNDESRYAGYLLDEIGKVEALIRSDKPVCMRIICYYHNLIYELCRISQPVVETVFKLENNTLYA